MSLSSGAYFGSHSTVSQGRAASALPVSRLVWIGPLSRTRTAGRAARPGCGPKRSSILSRSATKSVLRLVCEVCTINSRVTASCNPDHGHFLGLPWRLDPHVGAGSGKHGRGRDGERLGLVDKEKANVARRGLGLAQRQPEPDPIDRVGVMPAGQAVARPPPAEPPFSRSRMLSRDFEIGGPPRRSISALSRG